MTLGKRTIRVAAGVGGLALLLAAATGLAWAQSAQQATPTQQSVPTTEHHHSGWRSVSLPRPRGFYPRCYPYHCAYSRCG